KRESRFWSTPRRDALAATIGVAVVPCLLHRAVTLEELKELIETRASGFREGPLEGVVVRQQDERWLHARGKLVRAEFTQTIESHWRSRAIEWNQVSFIK